MKFRSTLGLASALFCLAVAIPANAALTFVFDENGNGRIDLGRGFVTLNGSLVADPSNGNSPALTFFLPTSVTPVGNGDVLVYEDFIGGDLSDVLRFTDPNGGLTGFSADRMIFYSLSPGPNLADTGIPGNAGTGATASVLEGADGSIVYDAGDNHYRGLSDASVAVPEPGSLALLVGSGVMGGLFMARRRRR